MSRLKPRPTKILESQISSSPHTNYIGTELVVERQAQARFAAALGLAIFERERSAVSFGNLPAENQANARAALLGGEERDEEVRWVGDARPVVLHPDFDVAVFVLPAHANTAAGFERGVHSIVEKINQKLVELRRVSLDSDVRAEL